MTIAQMLTKYTLVSDQVSKAEITIILQQLQNVISRNVTGDVVEFGCYSGTTSLFITRLLREAQTDKAFHVYDSFAGLPDKSNKDASPAGEQFKIGELHATKQQFIQHFKQAHLPLPVIHKGWFNNLGLPDIPETIAFAFLDGDYYESINDSFRLIEGRLSEGAVIIVDDYMSEALPGAAKAVDEWLSKHPAYRLRTQSSLAILTTI